MGASIDEDYVDLGACVYVFGSIARLSQGETNEPRTIRLRLCTMRLWAVVEGKTMEKKELALLFKLAERLDKKTKKSRLGHIFCGFRLKVTDPKLLSKCPGHGRAPRSQLLLDAP